MGATCASVCVTPSNPPAMSEGMLRSLSGRIRDPETAQILFRCFSVALNPCQCLLSCGCFWRQGDERKNRRRTSGETPPARVECVSSTVPGLRVLASAATYGVLGISFGWRQVTGIRKDAWANAHRIVVEEDKKGVESGQYLDPELFGEPGERRKRGLVEERKAQIERGRRLIEETRKRMAEGRERAEKHRLRISEHMRQAKDRNA
jgi:hypothetical protein